MCDLCNKNKLIQARDEMDKFVKAAELPWAKEYTDDGEHFDNLLKAASKLERNLKKYFKMLAPKLIKRIDWDKYDSKLADEKKPQWIVDITFNDDGSDDTFIEFITEPITEASLAGMASLAAKAPKGISDSLSTKITKQIEKGGKKYGEKLVPKLDETTKERINTAINESLSAGLTRKEATQVVNDIIDDPDRAELIAHTETVQGYSRGRDSYAQGTGAIGKIWHTQSGKPCDDCQDCEKDGQIGIDETFSAGWASPDESHPGCYCYVEYVYPDE